MKILPLFLLQFILIPVACIGQDYTMLDKYSSPISSLTYTIGDNVTIGKASNTSSTLLYSQVLIETRKPYKSFTKVNFDLSKRTGTIQKIFSNQKSMVSEFSNSVVLEIRLNADTTVFIPIDKALKAKEVVVFTWDFYADNYTEYSEETSTLIDINNQKLGKEEAMLHYLKKHDIAIYNELKSNEFTYEKKKATYINYVDSLRNSIDLSDTFLIILPVQLGKYNFDKGTFPIVEAPMNFGPSYNDVFSGQILEFDNFNQFASINSNREKAEFFANSTNLKYGDIRQAYVIALIQFKNITYSEKSGLNIDGPSKSKITHLHFNIRKLFCVDNTAFYYNLIGLK